MNVARVGLINTWDAGNRCCQKLKIQKDPAPKPVSDLCRIYIPGRKHTPFHHEQNRNIIHRTHQTYIPSENGMAGDMITWASLSLDVVAC